METEATDLVLDGKRVAGIVATTKEGPLEIRAGLVIAADGRSSILRDRAGLEVIDTGAPIDVLWMRLSKHAGDPPEAFGNVGTGGLLVTIDRMDYFQCAMIIQKGGYEQVRAAGLLALRTRVASLASFLRDRVDELRTWDDVKLLTVKVDHLKTWHRAGPLCIGDAAHAMSPIGARTVAQAGSMGPPIAIDGVLSPPPLAVTAGVAQRLRFSNSTLGGENLVVSLSDGSRVLD